MHRAFLQLQAIQASYWLEHSSEGGELLRLDAAKFCSGFTRR